MYHHSPSGQDSSQSPVIPLTQFISKTINYTFKTYPSTSTFPHFHHPHHLLSYPSPCWSLCFQTSIPATIHHKEVRVAFSKALTLLLATYSTGVQLHVIPKSLSMAYEVLHELISAPLSSSLILYTCAVFISVLRHSKTGIYLCTINLSRALLPLIFSWLFLIFHDEQWILLPPLIA